MMTRRITMVVGLAAVVLAFLIVGATKNPKRNSQPTKYSASEIKRGEYLVNAVGGCSDCHTPQIMTPQGPAPDSNMFLAGAPQDAAIPDIPAGTLGSGKWGMLMSENGTAWAGPWGVSFSANITPDAATGIGGWTEKIFISALRNGKHWGSGRDILPPMPWQDFRNMTDNDLRDIYAYLMSIKPVKNVVPAPIPPKE